MIIKLPDNWSDVTMRQFQELESTESIVDKIAILSDEDPEIIKKMDIDSFNRVSLALEWVHKLPEEKEGQDILTIDGVKYGMCKLSELSLGNWMDIEHYLKEPIKNLHKLMAIFYRPFKNGLIEDYDTNTSTERAELFLDKMSVNDAHGTLVFFSLIAKKSLTTIKVYFQMEILKMESKKQTQTLSQNKKRNRSGRGLFSLITWLKGTSQRWKAS